MVEAVTAPIASGSKKILDQLAKNIQPPPEVNYTGVRQLGEGPNSDSVQKHAISEHYKGHNLANVLRALVHVIFYITLMIALGTLGPTIAKLLDYFV
jgi:hypothetical protein